LTCFVIFQDQIMFKDKSNELPEKYESNEKIKLILLTTLLAVLVTFAFLFLKTHLAIDRCLDNGGRWDYETHQCEK